jgi:hypothetical protein
MATTNIDPDAWIEVEVILRFRRSVLVPGGECRDQPSTAEELVEEIDRRINASWLGGQMEMKVK